MPTFLECAHCSRLYSKHSLLIHEKNCVEAMHKILEQAKVNNNNSAQKRGLSKSGKHRKIRPSEMTVERPRTRSLSRYNHENSTFIQIPLKLNKNLFVNFIADELRICFVCGEQYDGQVIEEHKEKCYGDTSTKRHTKSNRFRLIAASIASIARAL
uniref:Uncharacterized protein n=1 Tax=Caenorhabditis japonica TaxID=281687 RepID=A0A8R1E7N2_CAEJA